MKNDGFYYAVELAMMFGATVLLFWAAIVYKLRVKAADKLGGQWLALSWGFLLLGVLLGIYEHIHHDVRPTAGVWPTIVGIFIGIYAMQKGFRANGNGEANNNESSNDAS